MAKLCDASYLQEITGETNLSDAGEIEIIFTEIPGFAVSLNEHLPNLRSLSLIDTNLASMGALGQISVSLQSLHLTKQGLRHMEDLSLPNLVELVLQDNAIQRIEGLSGCPKLRRLWLSRNRIKKLENLHCVANLRELWVQQNELRDLSGLESNSCLRDFEAGGNDCITQLSQVEPLAALPNLSEVSFVDDTFGGCPLVRLDSYREAMICTLKQIRILDDVVVHEADREAAEDEFLNRQLEFNDRVERLRYEHEAEVKKLQEERKNTMGETEQLRGSLLKSFEKLEEVVTRGRARIKNEQRRQRDLREKNAEELKKKLMALQKEHAAFVESLRNKDLALLAEKERELQSFRTVAQFQLYERNLQARLEQAPEDSRTVFQVLKEEHFGSQTLSIDLQNLCIQLYNDQAKGESILKVLRASRVFNRVFKRNAANHTVDGHPDQSEFVELYAVLSTMEEVASVLGQGFSETQGSSPFLVLFSDPRFGHKLTKRLPADSSTLDVTRMLLCRVHLKDCSELHVSTPASFAELISYRERISSESSMARFNYSEDERSTACFYILRGSSMNFVIPEVYLVLQEAALDQPLRCPKKQTNICSLMLIKAPRLDTTLQDLIAFGQRAIRNGLGLSKEDSDKLDEFEDRIESYMKRYEDCIFQELDPETAEALDDAENKVHGYKKELSAVREQIEREKTRQEQILRDFGKNNPSGKRRR